MIIVILSLSIFAVSNPPRYINTGDRVRRSGEHLHTLDCISYPTQLGAVPYEIAKYDFEPARKKYFVAMMREGGDVPPGNQRVRDGMKKVS